MWETGGTTEVHRVEVTKLNSHMGASGTCGSARGNLQETGQWIVLGLRREVGLRKGHSGNREGSGVLVNYVP